MLEVAAGHQDRGLTQVVTHRFTLAFHFLQPCSAGQQQRIAFRNAISNVGPGFALLNVRHAKLNAHFVIVASMDVIALDLVAVAFAPLVDLMVQRNIVTTRQRLHDGVSGNRLEHLAVDGAVGDSFALPLRVLARRGEFMLLHLFFHVVYGRVTLLHSVLTYYGNN